jgi:hypothetical protein
MRTEETLSPIQLKARYKALLDDIQRAERKRARLDSSIKGRKQTLNRLQSQIALTSDCDSALPTMVATN